MRASNGRVVATAGNSRPAVGRRAPSRKLPSTLRRLALALLGAALCSLAAAAPGEARYSPKKSIWGPIEVNGVSQFPIYRDLGVGILQDRLNWFDIARTRPARPRDPADPAYTWPPHLDRAVQEGRRHRIRLALQIMGTPRWANGGRHRRWAPRDRRYLADFATAAARRYPGVKLWMIWGEPSRRPNFMPLTPERRGRPLDRRQRIGPQVYARMLDAAYGALKRVSPRNLVIGGNTWTAGDISPLNFIRYMRLPGGRPPRMDLYGHNPLSARQPMLRRGPLGSGLADFSDLDELAGWVDRYLGRVGGRRRGPKIKLFLSEFFLPTDHPNYEINLHVKRRTAATWLAAALRITRRWGRIHSLGWLSLYDEPPNPAGDQVHRGLLDYRGRRKPAYHAYRDG